MPEVRRGSKASRHASDPSVRTGLSKLQTNGSNNVALSSPGAEPVAPLPRHNSDKTHSNPNRTMAGTSLNGTNSLPLSHSNNGQQPPRPPARTSSSDFRRKSLAYDLRPEAEAYYDSRAATQREYRRRAHTLGEYYDEHPHLLPQLPFTFRHGNGRWRLGWLLFLMFVDSCAVPIALYYGMFYAGNVEGWIIFAIVTTIWGGPAYVEFAVRTLRLIKKESFYRPLGTESRWAADITTWITSFTITVVTALFIIGSAPHIVWLRVLCMPAPAILYCVGGCLFLINLYNECKWAAPFRISSTAKGEAVLPGAYYFLEDVMAVNARAGRPYREALAARYKASPRFRKLVRFMSWFWAIPPIIVAIPLTVIAVIHAVPATAAYGVCEYPPRSVFGGVAGSIANGDQVGLSLSSLWLSGASSASVSPARNSTLSARSGKTIIQSMKRPSLIAPSPKKDLPQQHPR